MQCLIVSDRDLLAIPHCYIVLTLVMWSFRIWPLRLHQARMITTQDDAYHHPKKEVFSKSLFGARPFGDKPLKLLSRRVSSRGWLLGGPFPLGDCARSAKNPKVRVFGYKVCTGNVSKMYMKIKIQNVLNKHSMWSCLNLHHYVLLMCQLLISDALRYHIWLSIESSEFRINADAHQMQNGGVHSLTGHLLYKMKDGSGRGRIQWLRDAGNVQGCGWMRCEWMRRDLEHEMVLYPQNVVRLRWWKCGWLMIVSMWMADDSGHVDGWW